MPAKQSTKTTRSSRHRDGSNGEGVKIPGGLEDPSAILITMDAYQSRLMILCEKLEDVADSLPHAADPGKCMALARDLVPTLISIHRFEERRFFPFAKAALDGEEMVEKLLSDLVQTHREDEGFAEEISEVLADYGLCATRWDPETVGYMLRSFFVGLRRHITLERHALLEPLLVRSRANLDS